MGQHEVGDRSAHDIAQRETILERQADLDRDRSYGFARRVLMTDQLPLLARMHRHLSLLRSSLAWRRTVLSFGQAGNPVPIAADQRHLLGTAPSLDATFGLQRLDPRRELLTPH